MVTSVPVRRVAHALIALAVAAPPVVIAGVAWADVVPGPIPGSAASTASATPGATPAAQPVIGTWIVGGTLQSGQTAGKTAVQPAVIKPAVQPAAAKPAAVQPNALGPARVAGLAPLRVSSAGSPARAGAGLAGALAAAPGSGAATVLPFTGGHLDALLPTGILLVVAGIALTLLSRPRRRFA